MLRFRYNTLWWIFICELHESPINKFCPPVYVKTCFFFYIPNYHPNNLLSLQMRVQTYLHLWIYATAISNTVHTRVDLHDYIFSSGIISSSPSFFSLVHDQIWRITCNTSKSKVQPTKQKNPLKHNKTFCCTHHWYYPIRACLSSAARSTTEICTKSLFPVLCSWLTMNREILRRFMGLWSSEG